MKALEVVVNMTGLVYYFLGLERRAKKCLWVRLRWVEGHLQRKSEKADEQLRCKTWVARWKSDGVVIEKTKSVA